ncbi:MAG: hypothetical protein LBU89_07785, partial [Fibromonadaceae bacterium]|nr:hypothetical protein [Fibromonadaceae bacterium]
SDFVAPGLLEANEKLEYSRLSLSERRAYDKYVDTIRSNNSSLYTAKLKGKLEGEALGFEKGEALGEARGIEKGKAEGILQVAKKMIEQGINTDVILKVTGLSKEDMVKLTGKEPITMETLLTQNFKVKEFLTGPNPPKWDDLSERVQGQIKELANMLQTIRDAVKKPISISSGLRTLEDYNRMVKNKLNPSKKSDHFFGQTVDGYSLGLGAVDITCKGMDTIAFYNLILKMKYEGKIKCGQLLLEKNKTFWVHIANHWGNWLKEKERESRSLNDNGYSLNNGKSFTWLLSGEFAPSDLGNSK